MSLRNYGIDTTEANSQQNRWDFSEDSPRRNCELEVSGHIGGGGVAEKTPQAPAGPGRPSRPASVCPSPSVEYKTDGLPLPVAVLPVLSPRWADWTVRDTGWKYSTT